MNNLMDYYCGTPTREKHPKMLEWISEINQTSNNGIIAPNNKSKSPIFKQVTQKRSNVPKMKEAPNKVDISAHSRQ
jgi:hypothetical protein